MPSSTKLWDSLNFWVQVDKFPVAKSSFVILCCKYGNKVDFVGES